MKEAVLLKGQRVFITGGAGFIGSALARELIQHNEVVIYDNLWRNALRGSDLVSHGRLTLAEGDVLDYPSLREAMQSATHVVHMAAITGVDAVLEDPVRTMRVNMLGTVNALEAAWQLPQLKRFVDLSTSEVFGTNAYQVEETHTTTQGSVGEARWSYAVSKLAGEYLAHSYFHQFQMPIVTVRPFNVYGPNQVGMGAVHQFVVRALRGEDLIVHGDGSQIRAWCYIDDAVRALLLALTRPEAVGQCFNIGNPRSTVTVFDLAERVVRLSRSPSKIVFQPISYADIEIRVPNIERARQLLGYEPQVDLDEGLRRTIEWYRQRQA